MKLTRFENVAFDLAAIFMIRVTEGSQSMPNQLEALAIFADVPTADCKKPIAVLRGRTARDYWEAVKRDKKFDKFEGMKAPVAIDMTKVCAVGLDEKGKNTFVVFRFAEDRFLKVEADPELAHDILESIKLWNSPASIS